MTFEDWYETHFGDQPSDDSTVAVAPVAGGGAGSNELRQLWDRTPPLEPMRTEYLAPNFESNLPQVAAQPLPSPPYSQELNYAGKVLQELAREAREGTGTSPEALDEVRNNPTSLKSIATYGQWLSAIMMGGKGGEKVPLGPKGAVPAHIWNSWELATPGDLTVRVDNAGNHFKFTGSHTSPEGYHAIVEPVESPYDVLREKYPEIKEGPYKGQKPFDPQESEDINAINNPVKPEPGSIWDEWSKKHNDQKPDFDNPPPTLKDIYDDLKANPEKSDFWASLPGPEYIEGRGMAMPYSDEGEPFLPPPPNRFDWQPPQE